MHTLIQDIQNRLAACVPTLQYIDEDWGQLDDYSPNHPVKWPCALIDIAQVSYSNLGKTTQIGEATLTLTLADIKLQKAGQTRYLQLIEAVHKALHAWHAHPHYSRLIRTTHTRIKRDDGVRQHQLTYTCRISEAEKPENTQDATPKITVNAPNPIPPHTPQAMGTREVD